MKIAAQLYTVREFLKTPEDIATSLKKIKQIGYNAVQVSGIGPIDTMEFKQLMDQEQLEICATHVPYGDFTQNLDEVIEKHQVWGCKYVGLGAMPPEYRTSKDGYISFARQFSDIGRRLKQAGMQFVYHNHEFEFAKFDGKTGMDILLEETDPEDFHILPDLFWVQAGGADPVEWIIKLKGRMKVVHLKDFAMTNDRERRFAEIGEGNMNYLRILEACGLTGVEWAAVEQDNCYGRDPFESLRISFNHLIKLGAEA